jgi:membrane fusion protein (multidrug efflux system)
MIQTTQLTRVAAACVLVLAIASCGKKDAARRQAAPAARCRRRKSASSRPNSNRWRCRPNCRRASNRSVAQVRARVNGVVLKRLFTEGSEVKQGQSLFQIDPAPYQAQLAAAQAASAAPRPT